MKLHVLLLAVALVCAFLQRSQCRIINSSGAREAPGQTDLSRPLLPILMRLGEDYFIRLDNANQNEDPPSTRTEPGPEALLTTVNRALQLQLTQRLLRGKVGDVGNFSGFTGSHTDQAETFTERERRSEEPPISLDLTFHLLREVLEMARAEQLAQQANNNRKMMEIVGK
ncbi:corticoliberin-1 [Chanos chanos]|uniref:Corticoliberin-1 n=1 Tax=Chanos chanos TaxID=29144 RepID=A0A6J2VE11_CHACN|nr:corticoliberin-1-like [Chanos chanos]